MFFAMLVGPSKVRMYSQDKEYELHGDVFISHFSLRRESVW